MSEVTQHITPRVNEDNTTQTVSELRVVNCTNEVNAVLAKHGCTIVANVLYTQDGVIPIAKIVVLQ